MRSNFIMETSRDAIPSRSIKNTSSEIDFPSPLWMIIGRREKKSWIIIYIRKLTRPDHLIPSCWLASPGDKNELKIDSCNLLKRFVMASCKIAERKEAFEPCASLFLSFSFAFLVWFNSWRFQDDLSTNFSCLSFGSFIVIICFYQFLLFH